MEINEKLENAIKNVRQKKPLVHHITNYVTVNDCANIVLAIGGSPVMADDAYEVEDIVSAASALVINIGTLNKRTVESMMKAGKKANEIGIPVILDPVGAGASKFRKNTALNLINQIKFSIIRGNLAEIKTLSGMDSNTKGVDSEETESSDAKNIAKYLAQKLNTVIAITGVIDYVSDGRKIFSLKNGNKMLSSVTGTGCMCTSLIGAYCGVSNNYLLAAAAGILTMSIAGEKAYENLSKDNSGSGSFRVNLINAVYNFSGMDFKKRGKIYEEQI